MNRRLPNTFEVLEEFVDNWALATQNERERRRKASTPDELLKFYNTILPRLEEALSHLNSLPLGSLPEPARRLFYLTLSFAEVAMFAECYGGKPQVPNSFEESRFVAVHGDRIG